MSVEEQRRPTGLAPTAAILPAVVAIGLMALFGRLYYLQIIRGEELSQLALPSQAFRAPIPSPRGQIQDRNGALLAVVKPSLAVMVTPADIQHKPDAIRRLAGLLDEDPEELDEEIRKNSYRRFLPFVAKVGITLEQAVTIEEQRAFMPGVFVRTHSVRDYPLGPAFAHAIGYVSGLSESDVERLTGAGLDLPSFVGKVGIERRYDLDLMGRFGSDRVDVDRKGNRVRTAEPPQPGDRLTLTLDAELQRWATEVLNGRRGAIVALEPKTGEVLCLVSSPAYDPNMFARRITREDWSRLQGDERKPMHNRAAASSFAPGSTFKIITLIAGIRDGVVSPGTTFVCEGSFRIGNRAFGCLGRHGRVDYEEAIVKSCNVYFANVSDRVGRKNIVEAAKQFGLGALTGIDILEEKSGTLPDDSWLARRERDWYGGDTINLGVGQGDVAATPLQMAQYASLIANRGHAFRPHLLRSKVSMAHDAAADTTPRKVAAQVQLSDLWWERILRAMEGVVTTGTGSAARIEGISFAGKTGSAEQGGDRESHAWFIGFAPSRDPKIAIAVILESAGQGGRAAAPVAKKIVERYLKRTTPGPES
ncbi:MAG: penicillin-binding protein 2 [Armatimonadetes bacterium]|nr:penicillin-binding protein 2 [Armatimonadota bacterium]